MMAGEADPQVVFNCLLSVCTYSNSDEEDRSIFRGLPLVLSLLFQSCTCHRQLFELIVGHVQHVEDDQPRVAMRLLEFCTLWSQHGMKEEVRGQKKKKKNLPTLTEGEEDGDNDHEDGFCKLRDDMRSFAEGRAPSQQKKNLLKELSSFSSSSSTSRGGAVLQRSSGKLFFLSSSARSSFSLFVRPFQWLMWDAEDIAWTLAHMTCAPLAQLKSWHFFEQDQEKGGGGENNSKCSTLASISNYSSSSSPSPLSQLSSLCNALSDFVTFSILQSAHCFGQEYCTLLTSHWIQIALALRTLRCYHMLHALQMAWQRHACDTQRWLWQSIAISNVPHLAQQKQQLDQWFDPVSRFAPLMAEQEKCIRQQEPFVPCIFLLQQRAILLQESPLIFLEEKNASAQLNLHRIGATGKMFRELIASQEKKLLELTPAAKQHDVDAMVSYFGVLNSFKMDEDDVYKRGDALRDKFTPQKYDLKKKVPKELIECKV